MEFIKPRSREMIVAFLLSLFILSPGWAMVLNINKDAQTINLKADEADLNLILENIADKAGLTIWSVKPLHEKVSADFKHIPLQEGLTKLLRNYDHAFRYIKKAAGQKPLISTIYVFSKNNSKSSKLTWSPNKVDENEALFRQEKERFLFDPGEPQDNTRPRHGIERIDPLMRPPLEISRNSDMFPPDEPHFRSRHEENIMRSRLGKP